MFEIGRRFSWVLLILTIALAGCSSKEAVVDSSEEDAPVPVQVSPVVEGIVEVQAGLTGRLIPAQEVKIAPKVSGKISSISVTLGQKVKKGDVLFTLDKSDLVNQVEQAQASYQSAAANLNHSQHSLDQAVTQAQNGLKQAEQALADAQVNEQRLTELYREGAVPKQQLEQAQTALNNAQISYDNAVLAVQNAEKKSSLQVSEASVRQAQVTLQHAREQLAYTTVYAPISGLIASVNGEVGEFASSQASVVTLVDTSSLLARVHLSENEIGLVKEQDHVQVEVPSMSKTIEAQVRSISPVMDQQQKAYPMEVLLSNEQYEMKADLVIKVKLLGQTSDKEKQALVIPRKAMFEEQGKSYVYKIDGEQAKKVEFVAGAENSDTVEVVSGLAAGDQVVVTGQTLLSDGTKVTTQ
jgi:HlyD family secretion protein